MDQKLIEPPTPTQQTTSDPTTSTTPPEEIPVPLPQLKRIRWAVRATLFLGVAASITANVLHARHNPISQAISAWPPLALLLTVELTSRIPMHKPLLAFVRVLATVAIAGIAAWVSYWHMQSVALNYGETSMSSYLLPVSVDGLIVVASVSLVELAGRIRMLEEQRTAAAVVAQAPTAPVAPVQFVAPTPAVPAITPVFSQPARREPARTTASVRPTSALRREEFEAVAASLSGEFPIVEEDHPAPVSPAVVPTNRLPLTENAPVSPAVAATTRPAVTHANGSTPRPVRAATATRSRVTTTATVSPAESNAPRPRRPVQEVAELSDAMKAQNPNLTEADMADVMGLSESRLKEIRRRSQDQKVSAS
jgi:hypothetical protein